jgi:hypothetical protein
MCNQRGLCAMTLTGGRALVLRVGGDSGKGGSLFTGTVVTTIGHLLVSLHQAAQSNGASDARLRGDMCRWRCLVRVDSTDLI